jgi:hypothetical protein
MNLIALIIPLISGAVGSNAAGTIAIDFSLGPLGNSIVDALGGGVGGQILKSVLGMGGAAAASALDMASIVCVSGGVTALIVGLLKSKMSG